MPVLWSPDMKHQHEASAQDLEKRLRFLDEYKRIGDKAGEITDIIDINDDQREGEEAEDKSPSSQFFLTK
jgi:hypothetical protein